MVLPRGSGRSWAIRLAPKRSCPTRAHASAATRRWRCSDAATARPNRVAKNQAHPVNSQLPRSNSQTSAHLGVGSWNSGVDVYPRSGRPIGLAGASAFDLLEGLFDQPFVVFFRHVALEELRGNRDGDVHRFSANLLKGTRCFELDLPLGVLHDAGSLGLRFLLQLLAETIGVRPGVGENLIGLGTRRGENSLRLDVQSLQFLLRLVRVIERLADHVLPPVERLEEW